VSPRPGPGPTAGYSGKPLASKLGLRSGARVLTVSAPERYRRLLGELPDEVRFSEDGTGPFDVVHLFVTRRATLAARLPSLVRRITPAGAIWVSWPKRASRVSTDVTEDTVRAVAQPLGLVDVKVCAVNQVWSGLKLVIRTALRPGYR
jgi:hypothetical protein